MLFRNLLRKKCHVENTNTERREAAKCVVVVNYALLAVIIASIMSQNIQLVKYIKVENEEGAKFVVVVIYAHQSVMHVIIQSQNPEKTR